MCILGISPIAFKYVIGIVFFIILFNTKPWEISTQKKKNIVFYYCLFGHIFLQGIALLFQTIQKYQEVLVEIPLTVEKTRVQSSVNMD